ncbi:hypothetical protein GALMADRAFT_141605 [Galerina marginata CBS 339.88]|uniref:Uncharacterized protein n=1 Tax=Galerina marginata (strain CBS 339.88) TaxID=685588 RepID=A0A067T3T8_GALM3|nr:hypothetical protein GALMADRAFT_141605 [Galerina marginata CBS 339.88]
MDFISPTNYEPQRRLDSHSPPSSQWILCTVHGSSICCRVFTRPPSCPLASLLTSDFALCALSSLYIPMYLGMSSDVELQLLAVALLQLQVFHALVIGQTIVVEKALGFSFRWASPGIPMLLVGSPLPIDESIFFSALLRQMRGLA